MDNFSILAVFTDRERGLLGNTAAVIYLDSMPGKDAMQAIARDINQPATTFLVPHADPNTFDIRWFAPDGEIGLCGHGTLAALAFLNSAETIYLKVRRDTLSGRILPNNRAVMSIDPIYAGEIQAPDGLQEALGVPIEGYFKTNNKDIVLTSTQDVLAGMNPDFHALRNIDVFGYAVTAKGNETDFVSRTIVPHVAQLEDHATGSSHAALAPFWSDRLNKTQMTAIQMSPRGGYFGVEFLDETVYLTGEYTKILSGDVTHGF